MANIYRILGQAALAATTLTDVYTVAAPAQAIISTVVIANRTGVAKTFRLSVAIAGEADDPKQYIAYDAALDPNASLTLTLGITLDSDDVVRAYASAAGLSVNIFGQEIL